MHSPVFRTGGDEFVVILTGHDYENRQSIMESLHQHSVENIELGEVVVSGGIADYVPENEDNLHSVFERADAEMYKEKMLLKSLGAATR